MKKIILLIMLLSNEEVISQYKLSDNEIQKGFNFLVKNNNFRSSVQYMSVITTKKIFLEECFTWAKYNIRGKNAYGSYVYSDFIVFFFDGNPILIVGEDDTYFMYANNDGVPSKIIGLALAKGTLVSSICSQAEERRKLEQKSKQKIDSQKYSSINKLVADKSYDLANLELDKLNYPKEYPNYEKIKNESAKAAVEAASKLEKEKEKQDEIIANQINTLINEKKIFEASTKFSELNFPDNHSTLKVKIITELQTESKKKVIVFQTEKLKKLVELNKDQIKLLSTGNHILKVDGNGFVFIDGKETSIKTNPEIEQFGKNGYFKSPVSAECPLNITETKTNLGEEKMLVSSKKQIYSSLSGKIYEGSFFKTGLFSTIKVVQINYRVPKKHYQIIQPVERKMHANGIIILDEKINQLVKENKFANRTYKVISRASVLVVGSFYGILRIYETSLLPK